LGEARCRAVAYDATSQGNFDAVPFAATSWMFYFATPQIFHQDKVTYDGARFAAFAAIYIDGFARLVRRLLDARRPSDPLRVLYPSTVALDRRPKHMTEYAMAKAAGEILCADLMQGRPGLQIETPRLPRILTDQTATIPPVAAADATQTMLKILGLDGASSREP
jgi:hypothetical protein